MITNFEIAFRPMKLVECLVGERFIICESVWQIP